MTDKHHPNHALKLKRLGIATHQEYVVYMRQDCEVCRSEGFSTHARVLVQHGSKSITATVGQIAGEILRPSQASLSEAAWRRLDAREGDVISVTHAPPVESLRFVRSKAYGHRLGDTAMSAIIHDIVAGEYADIHLAAFVTACSGTGLDRDEMIALTNAMVAAGERLDWGREPIVDKHCVGGLPGNRTTPLVVAIATACGLTMPKTSSRAITSPAGTADTMETLAPVDLDLPSMRRVVEREGGCIVWGGAVHLSPADDILIRIERGLDFDSAGQLVASVLSKKAAAGATHLVLDMPVGPTAKVRAEADAVALRQDLLAVAAELGLRTEVLLTDGSQPVGRGIGPALEARDVLAVLRNQPDAPEDLRERALSLAAALLELVGAAAANGGKAMARSTLESGAAWTKFQAICEAQGGMRELPLAPYKHPVTAARDGRVVAIDNRRLARIAKFAGAPHAKAAGLILEAPVGSVVSAGQPLFTIHAETPGELHYALTFIADIDEVIRVEETS